MRNRGQVIKSISFGVSFHSEVEVNQKRKSADAELVLALDRKLRRLMNENHYDSVH
jgi:hypothetical protein